MKRRASNVVQVCLLAATVAVAGSCRIWQQQVNAPHSLENSRAPELESAQLLDAAGQFSRYLDAQRVFEEEGTPEGDRMAALAAGYAKEDTLNVNIRAYRRPDVASFVLPDGSIRITTGLLGKLDGLEAHYMVGHEIAHLALGHSKRRLETAVEHIVVPGAEPHALTSSELSAVEEAFFGISYSAEQEVEADRYAQRFLIRHNIPSAVGISAVQKLTALAEPEMMRGGHAYLEPHAEQIAFEPWGGTGTKAQESKKTPAPRATAGRNAGVLSATLRRSGAGPDTPAAPTPEPGPTQAAPARTPVQAIEATEAAEVAPTPEAPAEMSTPVEAGWYVHVGTESTELDAIGTLNLLHSVKLPAILQTQQSQGTAAYRVLVGPYESRQFAEHAARSVQAYGISADIPPVLEAR